MKKYILIILLFNSLAFGVDRYTEVDGITKAQSTANAVIISPNVDNWIVTQYDKLKVDTSMGTLSATNRRTLILMPGVYNITLAGPNGVDGLVLDTEFVDVVSFSNNRYDTIVTSANFHSDIGPTAIGQTVELQVDDVTCKGFTVHNSHDNQGLESGHAFHCKNSGLNSRWIDMNFTHDFPAFSGGGPFKFQKDRQHGGEFIRCTADAFAFIFGTFTTPFDVPVSFTDCVLDASGLITMTVQNFYTGTITRCRFTNLASGPLRLGAESKIIDSYFESVEVDTDVFNVAESGATFYNSTIVANGTGDPIVGETSEKNVLISQCRLNSALGANITNDIATPYNVIDSSVF